MLNCKSLLVFVLLAQFSVSPALAQERQLTYRDRRPQEYKLTARASEIDPRTKEHPEIDYVFEAKGKVQD